jgi:hypothetical protein
MFDSDFMNFTPCMHLRVATEVTGGRHFSEGEVWDDIQERLVCLECGEYVSEAEVRTSWGQAPMPKQEVSHGND